MYRPPTVAEYGYHSTCKCPTGSDDLPTDSYLWLHVQLAGLNTV